MAGTLTCPKCGSRSFSLDEDRDLKCNICAAYVPRPSQPSIQTPYAKTPVAQLFIDRAATSRQQWRVKQAEAKGEPPPEDDFPGQRQSPILVLKEGDEPIAALRVRSTLSMEPWLLESAAGKQINVYPTRSMAEERMLEDARLHVAQTRIAHPKQDIPVKPRERRPAGYITVKEASEETGYSMQRLRKLMRPGLIPDVMKDKQGGWWLKTPVMRLDANGNRILLRKPRPDDPPAEPTRSGKLPRPTKPNKPSAADLKPAKDPPGRRLMSTDRPLTQESINKPKKGKQGG